MTDKEKIRAEIERRIVFQKECIKNSYRLTGKPEEEIILEYKQLLSFIDSLPEEPVSIDFEQELYKAFGQVKDFTLGMRIAKWFYDMGKNSQEPVSEELEEEIKRYRNAYYRGIHSFPFSKIARHFANWQKQQTITKACDWLKRNADSYTWYNEFEGESGVTDDFVDEFKKEIQ